MEACCLHSRIVAYTTGLNVFLFFSIAFLSGSLADRLQRAGVRLERASSEIADLQAFNQHVIDSLASGLATTDRQGRILTFNRAAESITGHSALSVVGRRIEDVLELPPNVASDLRAGAAAGARPTHRNHLIGPETDGRSIWGSPPRSCRRQGETPGCCSRSRTSPISRNSSAMRGFGSDWPLLVKWPPASLTRFAIRSRRCRGPSRFSARSSH